MGFDRLMEDSGKKQWFIEEGKKLLSNMMKRAEKVKKKSFNKTLKKKNECLYSLCSNQDCTGFFKAYDEMVKYVSIESNWKNIKDELATRNVLVLNFYDIALDFILLDAFEDLEDPVIRFFNIISNMYDIFFHHVFFN